MPSGGLYATYHLLGEPETTIDQLQRGWPWGIRDDAPKICQVADLLRTLSPLGVFTTKKIKPDYQQYLPILKIIGTTKTKYPHGKHGRRSSLLGRYWMQWLIQDQVRMPRGWEPTTTIERTPTTMGTHVSLNLRGYFTHIFRDWNLHGFHGFWGPREVSLKPPLHLCNTVLTFFWGG